MNSSCYRVRLGGRFHIAAASGNIDIVVVEVYGRETFGSKVDSGRPRVYSGTSSISSLENVPARTEEERAKNLGRE